MQLEVELESGDALVGAGDFAIHVAEGILPADDVGEQFVILDFAAVVGARAEADADAGHGALQRHTRVKQCQRAAADAAIDVEPLDSMISAVMRTAYGKSSMFGMTGAMERSANAP